ncbi:MAG: magnesium chelatase, partial [Chloroflexi bacterium]|nr:magnesium chelatase [Chloroflexota bacterium]
GRYLSDELTIHYGLIPRTHRGIFCINELPDLAERIQVGLFNILEERDVQIRGYRVRLPLDIYMVATANPEDYTNRGRIITPLKDRCGSQIRTHYPKTIEHEIQIVEQERATFPDNEYKTIVPRYMKEIIAEITALARRSPEINQRSGVSVRISISNYENLLSNALRRGIRQGEKEIAPRISDLPYILASTSGKIELESVEEEEDRVIAKLIQGAVINVFNRYFRVAEFEELLSKFQMGLVIEVSESTSSPDYVKKLREVGGFTKAFSKLQIGEQPATIASGMEFILEGLHLNKRLNKEKGTGKSVYRS